VLLPTVSQQAGEAVVASAAAQSLRTWQAGWTRSYERLKLPTELRRRVDESLLDAGDRVVARVRESVIAGVGILSYLPWLVLIPVLAFFLLKDAESLRQAALNALPQRFRGRGYRLFEELNTRWPRHRAQLLACVLVGTACGIGFAALGLPYAALLGVLAGVLEFIPLVGPLVMRIGGQCRNASRADAVLWSAGLAVIRVIEDYVVYPRLMGRGIRLHQQRSSRQSYASNGRCGDLLAIPVVAALSVARRHGLQWLVNRRAPRCEWPGSSRGRAAPWNNGVGAAAKPGECQPCTRARPRDHRGIGPGQLASPSMRSLSTRPARRESRGVSAIRGDLRRAARRQRVLHQAEA
jgi:hypothetical protein